MDPFGMSGCTYLQSLSGQEIGSTIAGSTYVNTVFLGKIVASSIGNASVTNCYFHAYGTGTLVTQADFDSHGSSSGCVVADKSGFGIDETTGRLKSGSRLIDAGYTLGAVGRLDLAGKKRVSGDAVDVGCYEINANGTVLSLR